MSLGGEGAASFPVPTAEWGPVADGQRSCAGPLDPNHAEALFELARLVESGLPMPTIFPLEHTGGLMIVVRFEDLPAWMIALDLPAPEWHDLWEGDVRHRSARWPAHVFDRLLFRIAVTATTTPTPALNPERLFRLSIGGPLSSAAESDDAAGAVPIDPPAVWAQDFGVSP